MHEFVARGVDAILNEPRRAGRRSKGLEVQKNIRGSQLTARASRRERRAKVKSYIFYRFFRDHVYCSIMLRKKRKTAYPKLALYPHSASVVGAPK